MKQSNHVSFNEIEGFMNDAKYNSLKKPFKNIYKTVCIWSTCLFITELVNIILTRLSVKFIWVASTWYYPFHNTVYIGMHLLSLGIFLLLVYRNKQIQYREKRFLLFWSLIPLLICLYDILPVVILQLNSALYFSLYAIIPWDWLIFVIGMLIISFYRSNKGITYWTIFNVILVIIFIFVSIIVYTADMSAFSYANAISTISDVIYTYYTYCLYVLVFTVLTYWSYKHV